MTAALLFGVRVEALQRPRRSTSGDLDYLNISLYDGPVLWLVQCGGGLREVWTGAEGLARKLGGRLLLPPVCGTAHVPLSEVKEGETS
jgi:hypothetical protein